MKALITPGKEFFENIYSKYNKKDFIYSDPLQFPIKFSKKEDIEISSLISSSLAYGNVKQIIRTLNYVFSVIKNPHYYVLNSDNKKILRDFKNFKHRFTKGEELSKLILNLKEVYKKHKDLENFFIKNINQLEDNIYEPSIRFLKSFLKFKTPTLIPDPDKNSAFKRFNLFLRWLVRKDEVDMGIWRNIPPSFLIIPLDTHMLNISRKLGITKRRDNSIITALEITNYFKKINPKDPVKYDFSLTRAQILKRF